MRLATAVLGAALVFSASAAAAQKPDFSGKWTVDTEKTTAANPGQPGGGGPPGGGGGGGGRGFGAGPMTVKQDAATLTQERETQNGVMSTVYKLDGTETVTTTQRGEQKNKATWEGNTLVIVTTRPGMDGATMTTKTVWALEGEYLVQTSTGQMGGNEFTRKTFYKKGA
jgi:hypothetical protein